jgi:hypothetical protein
MGLFAGAAIGWAAEHRRMELRFEQTRGELAEALGDPALAARILQRVRASGGELRVAELDVSRQTLAQRRLSRLGAPARDYRDLWLPKALMFGVVGYVLGLVIAELRDLRRERRIAEEAGADVPRRVQAVSNGVMTSG